ncbi:DUF424 family protein [Methanoplanus sp. FWC-SCC4]|uniref:DUF424 family protein n=1 Tax=Methanochimaera problematica TaxID=2609417 RepID=A0AA97FF71_9EURY|nr:DUF424 family protein [Methanoplanus sp. FWC-SCC4]WOF16326.1 DUF424 family protein [Methanoplanus sp. FWC-SCC4]
MYLKIHHVSGSRDIVAACDSDLLNTTICDGDIEIFISDKFYGTEEFPEDKLREALSKDCSANLIGEKVIEAAIKLGFVERDMCISIGGIPHAQII